jgi:ABC-2 type transport system ATP-binding protein
MKLNLIDVNKNYKNKVLDGVSFELDKGVYGLLGPNGAGKSTLIRLICGIEEPDNGKILWNEEDIHTLDENYRDILGYVPQKIGYYPDFTAMKFMEYIAQLKGIPKDTRRKEISDALSLVNLSDTGKKKIKNFSGGMKQRLGIAQAILNHPQLLILDEPTVGLDIDERMNFKQFISGYAKDKIVLFATHIVSDIEDIGNEIILLKNGKIDQQGSLQALLELVQGKVWKCVATQEQAVELKKQYKVSNMRIEKENIELRIVSDDKPLPNAITVEGNLQDLYLYTYNTKSE